MTREEAYKLIDCTDWEEFEGKYWSTDKDIQTYVIDKIFDHFESRSCESCEYCYKGQNIQWCDNPEVNKYRNMAHRVDLDFYCKYWSAKDKDK